MFSHTSNLDGAGRSLVDLVRGLAAKGVKCLVVLPKDGPIHPALVEYGCTVFFVPDSLYGVWLWTGPAQTQPFPPALVKRVLIDIQNSIIPQLKSFVPDFIVSQTIVSPWGAACSELTGIKHIFCPREYGQAEHGLNFRYPLKDAMRAMYKTSDWIFTCSKGVALHLFEDDFEEKTEAIYGSIKLDEQHPEPSPLQQLKLPIAKTVAQIAAIAPGKGQMDLVNAVIALSEKGIKLNCLLLGTYNNMAYKAQLEHVIAQSGFSNQFRFLEFTNTPYALMSAVDIIVSCATYEGFGRTLLEGTLLDKPIIFADHGGPAEVFVNHEHALNYQPRDHISLSKAIENVIHDTQSTRLRIDSAKAHLLANFNDGNYGEKIYHRLCELSGTHARRKHHTPLLSFLSAPITIRFKIILNYLISQIRMKVTA